MLAAAALLALSGALALPATAQAQTTTTFVSNTGETQGTANGSIAAQSFTTGSSTYGYTLSEVAFQIGGLGGSSSRLVKVKRDNGSGRPGELVANLVSPSIFPFDSLVDFTAPASTVWLAAGTVYWVVVNEGRGLSERLSLKRTASSDQTATPADPNWFIGNTRLWKTDDGSDWTTSTHLLMFAINGTVADLQVTGTAVTSSPDADSNYETGDVIQVTVTFSGAVTVDTASGTPSLALTIGSNTRYAEYSAGNSTATELAFAYTVVGDDKDNDGISIDANALELNGGAIHKEGDTSTDAGLDHGALSTRSGHRVNRDVFIVSGGVSVLSTPLAATDTYGAGEIIEIEVEFSGPVNATTDTDFVLSVSGAKRAPLLRGSGTNTLVFGYTVQAGDSETNGIWIGPSDQTLEGNRNGNPQNGAITSAITGLAAVLAHGEVGTQSGHKVNGSLTPPEVTIAADHEAFTAEIDDVTFTLTRTEDPAAALTVGVALTQDQDLLLSEDLAQNVTFGAGEATATLQLPLDLFVGHTVTEETTLTATVQAGRGYVPGSPNTASTRIVVTDPAVTASIEATAYTFAEGADATVTVIVRTATGVPSPNRSIPLALTFYYTGLAGSNDLAVGNVWFEVEPSDFTPDGAEFIARKEVTLPIVDDALDEPDETLTMRLDKLLHTPFVVAPTQLDGTVCPSGCSVTVTITDNDEPDETMQTAGGATWTLTGERTPAPGDTYTYSITLASGAKPNNEYVGFYLPDSATNQDLLGNDHTDCAAPKQFCATFTGATGNASVWDGTGGHDTISYLLGATSPHTATATLAITDETPLGTVITFGPIENNGTPRSGGLTITVIEPGGAVPNAAPAIATTSLVAVAENGTAVATLAATDADDDPITWSKTGGADTARFALTTAGVLTFVAAPDYESPADVASADPANAAANNEYVVFVTASDGTDDTELELVVRVTNADEGQSGTVSIDDTAPMVGDELTASTAGVADPDGLPDPFAPTWKWYRTPSGGSETEIAGAASATYTVVEADVGAVLTAKASWTDVGGFTNTLASAPSAAVTPDVPAAPSNLLAAPGDMTVVLSWGEPASTIARHDYRFKTDGSYPVGWTPITDSAPGGANATGITVPSLTNGLAYTFQVRAVDMDGVEGEPAESATVTPAGGICARTLQVQTAILAAISGVDDCAAVTATHLSAISRLDLLRAGIGSLQSNDFAGLSSMVWLSLLYNNLAALPAGVFSGLSSLEYLDLRHNNLAALRADVFSGLSSIEELYLGINPLGTLPADVFSGLSSLETLYLNYNELSSLPAGVFSGLTALETLWLNNNSLNKLPAGVFSGLSSLNVLRLQGNDRTLPLIVSLEKVGAAGVRAVAPAGAPFALTLPVVVANGSLAGGATALVIATGEVATEAVTVIPGNTEEVTVDLGTPLPQLPSDHRGYAITRAATGLPVTTQAATTCTVNPGDLWCGVVTVDPVAITGVTNGHGYSRDDSAGDLRPQRFVVSPNIYTITTVATGVLDGGQRLLFSLDSGLPAAVRSSLELHVRGDQFAFSASGDVPQAGVHFWSTSQDWSSETSVTLRLRGLASTDATLRALAVSDDRRDLMLSPTFAPATTTYTAMAANADQSVTFRATENDDGARVAYLDADGNTLQDADGRADGFQVVLAGGAHVVRVRVTAEDGTTTETYTVTVTRSSSIVTDGVSVTSTPRAATDTYGATETIEISVTFEEAVNATTATDFVLSVGDRKRAPLVRGSGTATLVFGYTVLAGDSDDDGIWIGDQDRTLVGDRDGDPQNGAITSVATDLAAVLTHGEVGTQSGHKVNGSLTPPAANTAPVITTTSPVETPENGTAVVTLAATDADDDPITWSKTGGADTARFALTTAGALTFVAAPDYESPVDVASADPANDAANNEYVVFVTASDENADTDDTELELVVRVTNVDEGQSGTVSIDDTLPMVGDELTASTAGVADPDGLPDPFAPTWKWYRTPAGGAEAVILGATSATYTVVAADLDAALTAKASWTDAGGFTNTLASAPTAAVTATDSGTLPTVTIAADHESFTAVLDQVTFTLTRTGDPAEELAVSVALTQDKDLIGSAHLAQTVAFRAGEATATLKITANFFAGSTVTGETTLTATVQDGSDYTVGDPASASTRIRVADPAVTASFEQAAYTFDEAAGDATVAVILRTATGVPIPHADIFFYINYELITGGASDKGDFEFSADAIKFVPSDFTADGTNFIARKEVTLAIVDDEVNEPDEALTLTLEKLPSTPAVVALRQPDGTACLMAGRCDATVTITDNDESAVATLSALAVSGGGAELLTFSSDNTTYTAMVANDVETLTFSATKSDAGASVAYLDSDGNTLDDADTTEDGFQVPLSVGANAITVRVTAENGTTQDYTVTVTRAEGLPTVTVAAAAGGKTVPEGTDAAFTLSRTGATAAALTVTVTVSQTGSVLKDASAVPSSVTFDAGAATATLALATNDDDTDDDNGTVTVTLGADTGYTVGDPGAATVAVSDNDVPVDFVLAVPATVAEDAGPATVTVTATTAENAPPATVLAVQLARVGGTATGGTDYDAVSVTARFQVSDFAPATVDGQPRYQAVWTHDVVIHDDEVVEDDETVVLEMSPTSAFVLIHTLHGAHDAVRATLTIVDNDLPVVTIAKDKGTVIEDEGAADFTLSRTGPTAAELTVTVEVTQEVDRDLLPDGAEAERSVTFAVNSATAALSVALENDDLLEPRGELTVEVQAGSGYTVGDPGSATVNVVDVDSGLPKPANLMAEAGAGAGVGEVALSWDAYALHLEFSRHQYRYKTDGDYPAEWTDVPNSGQNNTLAGDGSNLTGYTVTGLVGGQSHTFQVRTFFPRIDDPDRTSDPSDEATATPRSAAVSFGAGSYSVDEGGTVEVTVQLDGAPGRDVVVPVSAAGAGGATPQGETGADWSGVPESVTFGATDTAQTFTLAATDDTDVDAGESVALSFGTLPAGVTAGTPSEATVTIVDDDAAMTPTCTLNAGDLWCGVVTVGTSSDGVGFVAADTDVGALTDNNGDQTITIGSDSYTISSLLVRNSPLGALSIDLDKSFPPGDVATLEFDIGTKTFKVSEATAYASGFGYFWTDSGLTWTDGGPDVTLRLRRAAEEEALPELSVANAEASEGDPVEFTVTLSPAAAENVTVNWATSVETGDTATEGTDFTAASGTLSITAGQTTATIAVQTTEDTTDEANETFTVTLSNPTNATLAADPTATGTITDAALPVVTIAADSGSYFEGLGHPAFTLSRTGPTAATLTVTVEVTQEVDRDLLPDGAAAERMVTFAVDSATATLSVTLKNDDLVDMLGKLTVEVQAGSGHTVGDPGSATVDVYDTGDTGRPQPANLMASAGSGAGEVVLSWDAHAPYLVFGRHQYRYKTDGDYPAEWTDIPNSGQNDSLGGDGSNLTGYTVTGLVGGQVHTFQVRTYTSSSSASDPSDEATATPRSAAVSFGAGSYSVDEGGTVEVTVQLDAAPGREVTVPVSAAGAGGATPPGETGADWSGVPESVTFGATDTEQTFTLAATDDADADAGESVALSFGTLPAGVTAGTPSEATVTITDNDVLPTLSVANAAAAESDGVAFTVTLSEAATTDVTVTWTASIETGDSAEAADFGSPLTETVTFTPSQTAVTITVPTIDDSTDEDNDTFTLTLSSPSANATLASDATATGSITDNDDPPTISVQDQTVIEGDQNPDNNPDVELGFPFLVTLSEASEKRVLYKVRRVELASDTAADADLNLGTALFKGSNAIGVGDTVDYAEADVIRNDDLDEPDETFTLEIYDFVYATAGAKVRSTITIQDDDDPPSVSVGDATAAEGAPVEFPVTLSAASGREVAVNWATTDDSATSPADFTAASGTLTVMPGETTATVAVATIEDTLDEPDEETFTLTLSSPSNATLGEATATGTITDNDDPPTLGVADAAATEGAPVEFTVTLSAAATADVTATWTASTIEGDEEKAAAADLESTTGSVTVPKGETTATFTVATAEDALDENNETFTVALSSPSSNATLAADATTATGTITDDDARPALIIADVSAPEESNVEFTVTLTPASGRTVTVGWGTFLNIGQTAEEEDFTSFPQNGFVTFPPGQTAAQLQVGVVDDELVESDETFEVTLGSASNARLEDNSAIGTIVDNDVAANAAPAFTSSDTFTPAENQTAAGTVRAEDFDGDAITDYALSGGADQALFSIGSTSGALTFLTAPNYENPQDANTDNAYLVVVQATSGTGDRELTATQTITVTVMDDDTEAPAAPDAPSVSPASVSSLTVTWLAPDNDGPEITDYDVQYRAGTSAPWSDGSHIGTALTAILTGLLEDTSYQVQVRATNAEGTGGWSASGSGATNANAAPSFTSAATFNPAENQTAVGTVVASDSDAGDEVTDYALSGGTDQALFSIGSTSGVLTFQAAPNYEDPQDANTDNAYVVVVQATSGTGDREQTATQTITVTVMDDDTEAPAAPDAPSVSPASVSSLTVTWLAPDNDGPEITDYDVQYRAGTSAPWSDGSHIGTALTAILTGLEEDTSYQVQVRATNAEGTGGWSASGSGATNANAAPSFTSAATFNPAENQTAVGTVVASDSDAGDEVTDYALSGGTDQALFSIGSTSGVLTFQAAPNYEDPQDANTDNAYVVVVQATSGTGDREQTATQTITVTVMDDDTEAPAAPDAPSVSPASATSLTVTWLAPDNDGPEITDYDVQYRAGTSAPWSDGSHIGTALTAILTGLEEDTSYQVQVRATNAEGTGGWSASGSGATNANAAPSFTSAATFNPAENQTAVGTVAASDSDAGDEVTDYALSGGTDQALFSIGSTSGVLTFQAAPNYEDPQDANTDNAYVVVVQATSGTGDREKTATQTITVTVMDDDTEAPAAPDAPSVSPASATSLTVTWLAPDNDGPEITDYDVQYRAGTSAPWSDGSHIGTALTAILTGLEEDTSYQVQVRATNAEGTGGWSASGSGATNANAAPSFTSAATFNPAENQTAVGTVAASDSDAGDEVTDYALSGGTDQALFSIGSTSGVLTFQAAPNYEDPQDANTDNAYVVVVQATSGTGDREQTATQTITVRVMDDDTEAPAAPDAPSVSPASATSLTVTWLAPDNDGPEIADYDYRYRTTSPQGAWMEVTNTTIAALRATIAGLAENTEYDVQVRATNDEGTGGWSASGSGATNAAPSLMDDPGVEGNLRLADEEPYMHPDGHEGVAARVEIFHAERWGTVCSDGFSRAKTSRFIEDLDTNGDPLGTYTYSDVDNDAPALVCQSMGYDTGEYASGFGQPGVPSQPFGPEMTYYPVNSTYPAHEPDPIWVDDMTCAAGDADLTGESALPAPFAHCGHAGWGLHNCSHSEDAGVRCWNVEDSVMAAVGEPLTAAFEGLPEAHDGETAFSFRLGFSEAVAVTPEAMRTRVLTVAGGAVTGAARVDGESGVWEITVTPDSREDLSIALARTEDCEAEGAVCTSDGRTLSVVAAYIVIGPGPETEPALTASFEGLPEAHDGEEGFHFRVAFSEEIGIGFRSMRDDSFTVDGGEVTGARRVDRRHDRGGSRSSPTARAM